MQQISVAYLVFTTHKDLMSVSKTKLRIHKTKNISILLNFLCHSILVLD
jgi:hypothetical protein